MDTIKSPQAALLHRVYHFRGSDRLAITVMAGFKISDPGQLVDEAGLWQTSAEGLLPGQALDLGMPKPQGETLIAGRAHAPEGRPVQGMEVGFDLESIRKRLYVMGDRHWTGGAKPAPPLSAPQPFSVMDLTWERAFGGQGFDDNPDGCGLAPIKTAEGLFWPAPNVQYPDRLITSPQDRPEPAGLGPRGLAWPNRLKNLGSYDDKWLRQDWPGLPGDFQFGFFNLAPPDQQLTGYFKGDESFVLHGLTPDKPKVASKLPDRRARAFLQTRPGDSQVETFDEIQLNLDTLWLFPHLDLGVVIWHGSRPITDDEADDVALLAAFLESGREKPQSVEYYQALCQSQASGPAASPASAAVGGQAVAPLAEAEAHPAASPAGVEASAASPAAEAGPASAPAVVESDPKKELPAGLAQYFPSTPPPPPDGQPEALLHYYSARSEALERQLDGLLRQMGVDPDQMPPGELPPSLANMYPDLPEPPENMAPEELAVFYRNQAASLEQSLDRHMAALDAGSPLEASGEIPYTVDDSLAGLRKIPGMEDAVKALEDLQQEYDAVSADLTAKQAELATLEQEQAAKTAAASGGGPAGAAVGGAALKPDASQTSAALEEHSRAVAAPESPVSSYSREEVLAARETGLPGADLTGLDLSGADLSGMDLSGANLTGANLEGAVLAQANLTGGNLSQTILTGAILSGAALPGADLVQSSMSQIRASGADFSGASLVEADLSGADLSGADLRKADLGGASLNKASLTGARASEARAGQADFDQADLSGADFSQAGLNQAYLNGVKLDQTVFRQADLSSCWISSAEGRGVDLTGADLHEIRSSGQTSLPGVQARGANLEKAYFEQGDLSRADFSGAFLDQASFIRCRLPEANFSRSQARQVDFSHSDLTGADLNGINLMQGSLRKAKLKETDLSRANLFAVDFYKSTLGRTNMEGANLKRTVLKMWTGK